MLKARKERGIHISSTFDIPNHTRKEAKWGGAKASIKA